jgi:hypothetical protein
MTSVTFSLPLWLCIALVVLFAVAAAIVWDRIRNAPLGHEDEDGFHADIEPDDLKEEHK